MSTIRVQVVELEGQLCERADVEALLVGELERVTSCLLPSVAASLTGSSFCCCPFPLADYHLLLLALTGSHLLLLSLTHSLLLAGSHCCSLALTCSH